MRLEKKLNHSYTGSVGCSHLHRSLILSVISQSHLDKTPCSSLCTQINPSQTQAGDVGIKFHTLPPQSGHGTEESSGVSSRLTSLHSTRSLSNFNTHISKQETTLHDQPHVSRLYSEPAKTDELHSSAQEEFFCIPLLQCSHNRKHLLHVLLCTK